MADKINTLEDRIEKVIGILEKYERENRILKTENDQLKAELSVIKKEHEELKLQQADRNNLIKEKLNTVLNRVGELESMDI